MNVNVEITVEQAGGKVGLYSIAPDQKALDHVLFDFNPSMDDRVVRIKALHAALIAEMEMVRTQGGPQARAAAIAITDLEKVQMVCVKSLFAKA